MKLTPEDNLRINIENTAAELASYIGSKTVQLYLQQHFGVSSPNQLASSDLDRAFDDLYFMLSEQQ